MNLDILDTVYLSPNEILTHPVVEEMEKQGIPAPPSDAEVKALVSSIKDTLQIQPIPVVRKDGKYYRIAGLTRLRAIEKIGSGVRCEVLDLEFSDEETIMRLHFDENIRRRHFGASDRKSLESKYKKFLSRRTKTRVNIYDRVHSAIKNLINKGILGIEKDGSLLSLIADLPSEAQEKLARSIKPVTVTEYVTEVEEKEVVPEHIKKEIEDYKKEKKRLQDRLTEMEGTLKSLENSLKDSERQRDTLEDALKKALRDSTDKDEIEKMKAELIESKNTVAARDTKIKELKTEIGKLKDELKKKQSHITEVVAEQEQKIMSAMVTAAASFSRNIDLFIKRIKESAAELQQLLRSVEYTLPEVKGTVDAAINKLEAKAPQVVASCVDKIREVAAEKNEKYKDVMEKARLDLEGNRRATKRKKKEEEKGE